jgi:hypothetical protein
MVELEPKEFPYVRAAFINAIGEEGTKAEAVEWLQKQWNETCWLRGEIEFLRQHAKDVALARAKDRERVDAWRGQAEHWEQEARKLQGILDTICPVGEEWGKKYTATKEYEYNHKLSE